MSSVSKNLRPGADGTPPYKNPVSAIDRQFFDPKNPNDAAFSDDRPEYQMSTDDPIGQIMADFKVAQSKLPNNGGR